MPGGGKQPGAGRPKGSLSPNTVETLAFRRYIREKIEKEKDPLIQAMINKAKGCMVQENKNGVDVIYSLPPDPGAFKVLIEHGHGRPREEVQVSGSIDNNFHISAEERDEVIKLFPDATNNV